MPLKCYAGAVTAIKSKPYNLFSFDNFDNKKTKMGALNLYPSSLASGNTVLHNIICQNKLALPAANPLFFIKSLHRSFITAAYKS